MAEEAGIINDLEQDGPTPQIQPSSESRRGRGGRGRGRGGRHGSSHQSSNHRQLFEEDRPSSWRKLNSGQDTCVASSSTVATNVHQTVGTGSSSVANGNSHGQTAGLSRPSFVMTPSGKSFGKVVEQGKKAGGVFESQSEPKTSNVGPTNVPGKVADSSVPLQKAPLILVVTGITSELTSMTNRLKELLLIAPSPSLSLPALPRPAPFPPKLAMDYSFPSYDADPEFVQAVTFLKQRRRLETVIRLRGELVLLDASRVLQETIDGNKSSNLISVAVTPIPMARGPQVHEATVKYAGRVLFRNRSETAKDAKNQVSLISLAAMMRWFFVIKIAASESAFTQPVSREDLLSGRTIDEILDRVENAVTGSHRSLQSSFGMKIMSKHGWNEGKGLGRLENGLLHPISCFTAASNYSLYVKRGLGYTDENLDFELIVRHSEQLFQCFLANSVLLNDLVFSGEFSTEEREVIHTAAEKYGLNHKSQGVQDGRHLVVRSKTPLPQLVLELQRVGGKAGRYELLEPGDFKDGNR